MRRGAWAILALILAGCGAEATPTAISAPPPATLALAPPTAPPLRASPTVPPTAPPTLTAPPATATPTAAPLRPPFPTRPAPRPTSTPRALTPAPRAGAPLVVLDAGHGALETGAIAANGLAEKDVNLAITLAAAADLRAAGVRVLLTRARDSAVNLGGADLNGDGTADNDDDLQARVDEANAAGAWLLVSIHNNALGDLKARGTTTYYCQARPFAATSRALADELQAHVLAALRAAGYPAADRQVRDDVELHKPGGHLYLLGPANERIARPSAMPGALVETLFLSNAADAAQLARPEIVEAAGRGVADGILAYLAMPEP